MRLTPKQEHFCRLIVAGKDGKEAYTTAYDTKANDRVRENEARKLLMRDDITERIAEMNKPLVNHAQNTAISNRKQQIEFIQERIKICREKEDEQSIIRYTDMLNKLYNLYKEDNTPDTQENTVNNLDINTLKKLSGAS